MKKILTPLIVAGFLAVLNTHGQILTYNFNDFNDTSGLTFRGDAATTSDPLYSGPAIRLALSQPGTTGGSVFSNNSVNASDFSTRFQFRISDPGGIISDPSGETGADGLAFVIAKDLGQLGGLGGGIGYQGLVDSVAIEFDTWENTNFADPSSNHVALGINGNLNTSSNPTVNVSPNFDNGDLWTAWIDYDGTDLEVRLNAVNDVRPTIAILSATVDIESILGQSSGFIGFTAATAGAWGDHDLVSWQYSTEFIEGGISEIPEPGTVGLLGIAGLGGFLFWRSRRKGSRV